MFELQIVGWTGISRSQIYDLASAFRQGQRPQRVDCPRDCWIEDSEAEGEAIVKFAQQFPLEGYRVSPSYNARPQHCDGLCLDNLSRPVKVAGLSQTWNVKPFNKGAGFVNRWFLKVTHQLRLVGVSQIHVAGTLHYTLLRYIILLDKFVGKEKAIFAARNQKLTQYRVRKKSNTKSNTKSSPSTP